MSVKTLRPLPVGIEIDVDLNGPLDGAERTELRELLFQHGLLVFRRQRLSHSKQIEIMECFGPVLHSPDGIGFISNDASKGSLGVGELAFHSDLSFTESPFRAISLHATEVVDGGSSTRFANGLAAYQRLSEAQRHRLQGLNALSVMPIDMGSDRLDETVPPGMPQCWQPLVLKHPGSGRPILYVNQQHSARIDGLSVQDSKALLRELFGVLYAPDNVYEHHWNNGDAVIWDNLSLQHSRGSLQRSGRRTLQRVVVAEKSFFELCPQIDMKDPEYLRWITSTDPAADRHLIERVVARGSGLM